MKKRLILIVLFATITVMLCGCGNNLPSVTINPSMFKSVITIDVGNGYDYTGFDIETVDGGKDLILHFVEESTGRVE